MQNEEVGGAFRPLILATGHLSLGVDLVRKPGSSQKICKRRLFSIGCKNVNTDIFSIDKGYTVGYIYFGLAIANYGFAGSSCAKASAVVETSAFAKATADRMAGQAGGQVL